MRASRARPHGRLTVGLVVVGAALGITGCFAPLPPPPTGFPTIKAPVLRGLTATLTDPGNGSGQGVSADYFSHDGKTLVAVDDDGDFDVWSTVTRRLIVDIPFTPSGTNSLAYDVSRDGKTVAIGERGTLGDESGRIYLENTATQAKFATLTDPAGPFHQEVIARPPNAPGPAPQGPPQGVEAIAFSPDGQTLAVNDTRGFVDFYRTAGAAGQVPPSAVAPLNVDADAMAFSPDGRTLAIGDRGGDTYLVDTATHRITGTLGNDATADSPVDSVAYSPDGRLLAVGYAGGQVYLWNTVTHAVAATLTEPTLPGEPPSGQLQVWAVFSPDGRTLATWDGYYVAYLWNIASRRIVAIASDPRGAQGVDTVAFSPDGRTLATGDGNRSTYLWAIPKGD